MSVKYEPLKSVIGYYCDQYGRSVGDEDMYWLMGFRGLSLMHYNTTAEPKTVRLPVESSKVVYFPADYVSWHKIGLLDNNLQVSILAINNSLTTFKSNNPSRLSLIADINDGWVANQDAPFINFYNNGQFETMYGTGNAGLQTYGSCRVDEHNNVVILDPSFPYSSILFEYISSPEKDTDYKVDVRLREALITFIAWKTKLDTRQNFYAAYEEANRIINPFRLQVFEEVLRRNERMTLKG